MAYASSGFLWDNVLSHGLTFRYYCKFVDGVVHPSNAIFMQVFNDLKTGSDKIKIEARANVEQLESFPAKRY
jgi:hypothetical protein